jgi:hypothetical protein
MVMADKKLYDEFEAALAAFSKSKQYQNAVPILQMTERNAHDEATSRLIAARAEVDPKDPWYEEIVDHTRKVCP